MCECGYDRECKPKDFECSHYVKCLEKQLNQLKAILTQIKEIAEKQCVCGVDCIDMKQILQKISEVEDG